MLYKRPTLHMNNGCSKLFIYMCYHCSLQPQTNRTTTTADNSSVHTYVICIQFQINNTRTVLKAYLFSIYMSNIKQNQDQGLQSVTITKIKSTHINITPLFVKIILCEIQFKTVSSVSLHSSRTQELTSVQKDYNTIQ